jgi:hypothetical protein
VPFRSAAIRANPGRYPLNSAQEDKILGWLNNDKLPEGNEVFDALCDANGLFRSDEGACWDFKDQWPFSLSDEYFSGIARAVCAFSNSRGGVLVFGVHDKHRLGGYNKVTVNFDKFISALNQLIGPMLDLSVRSYSHKDKGEITVLLIPPRPAGIRPFKFRRSLGRYLANVIWIRTGHQVLEASPANFPMLFCRSQNIDQDGLPPVLDGSLPPSPATLKRFIGRTKVIEDLFDWLQTSDEPRVYLYGKGGSGKTTIAFEFAQLLKSYGSNIRLTGGGTIDSIIFLSAKELSLITSGRTRII